jgi:hypothetical protein
MVLGVGISGAIFTTVLTRGDTGDPNTLFNAVQAGFSAIILVALLGMVTTAIRGEIPNKAEVVKA